MTSENVERFRDTSVTILSFEWLLLAKIARVYCSQEIQVYNPGFLYSAGYKIVFLPSQKSVFHFHTISRNNSYYECFAVGFFHLKYTLEFISHWHI